VTSIAPRPIRATTEEQPSVTVPDATILLVEDEDSFIEALTVGLKR
jgi:hypothetical protein